MKSGEKLRRFTIVVRSYHQRKYHLTILSEFWGPLLFYDAEQKQYSNLASTYYVPFGKDFILHPHNFVLAVTLEWIRMPLHMTAYITGRSSWGRHGLIIETAPGVHPGFTGCLTLEMANVGDVPIKIRPGTRICQLFFHDTTPLEKVEKQGSMIARRQPFAPAIVRDEFEKKLNAPP